MTDNESCCTCAALLTPPSYDYADEKKTSRHSEPPRRLPCCNRSICASCMHKNPRFETYCPFCQVSTQPSSLPQGLRDPPAYSSPSSSPKRKPLDSKDASLEEPPAYDSLEQSNGASQAEDVIHHLRPDDTIASLSLAYNVPSQVLRTHNTLFSDHLLSARRTVAIPASHYSGPSLSSEPLESEEETERKRRIRTFMTKTKCHEYNVAELYLKNANEDLEGAVRSWEEDERWERENPMRKGKGKGGGFGGGLTGQLR